MPALPFLTTPPAGKSPTISSAKSESTSDSRELLANLPDGVTSSEHEDISFDQLLVAAVPIADQTPLLPIVPETQATLDVAVDTTIPSVAAELAAGNQRQDASATKLLPVGIQNKIAELAVIPSAEQQFLSNPADDAVAIGSTVDSPIVAELPTTAVAAAVEQTLSAIPNTAKPSQETVNTEIPNSIAESTERVATPTTPEVLEHKPAAIAPLTSQVEGASEGEALDRQALLPSSQSDGKPSVVREPTSSQSTVPGVESSSEAIDVTPGQGRVDSPAANFRTNESVYTPAQSVRANAVTDSVKSAVLIATTQSESRIKVDLDPPELGSVRIELVKTDSGVAARIVTEVESTAHLLQDNLPQLKRSLEDSGVEVQDFDFHTQSDQRQQSQTESQRDETLEDMIPTTDTHAVSTDASQPIRQLGSSGMVDVMA